MRIGQLATQSGLPAHTIRFYESKQLLPETARSHNGYREYKPAALERLGLIQLCQRLGFSLGEMQVLFARDGEWDKDDIMHKLSERAAEIEAMQQQLSAQKQEIISVQARLKSLWDKGQCFTSEELALEISKTK